MTGQFEQLSARSDRELFARLGRIVDRSMAEESDESAEQAGRSYFEARLQTFAATVCNDPRITELRRQHADGATLAAAIMDLLTSLVGVPGVATVTILLLRYGLDKLCGASAPK